MLDPHAVAATQYTMRRAATLMRRTSTHVWQASSCAAGEDGHRLREWASKHADDARDVLRPPPHGTRAPDLSGLDQYLHSRNWAKVEAPEARALLSQALTYPLSLAAHAATLNLSAEASIAIVGARAEAALSTAWWAELIEAVDSVHDWTLTFVGPEVKAARPTPIQRGTKSLAVKAERRELTKADLDEADAVVLFNPGVGHPHLAEGWVPALDAIRASGRPLLVTGHSEMDSRRDLTALEARYGALRFAAPPCQNPFRSRVVIVDPADATHMTSANAWAFVVEGL